MKKTCLHVEKAHHIQATRASFFGEQKARLSCHLGVFKKTDQPIKPKKPRKN
jgi:hypothetical protein